MRERIRMRPHAALLRINSSDEQRVMMTREPLSGRQPGGVSTLYRPAAGRHRYRLPGAL